MPKIFCNYKAESVALVYGIINAVITGILSISLFILQTYKWTQDKQYANKTQIDTETFVLFIVPPIALIGCMFAVLLIVAIKKKIPRLVMFYFVFRVIETGLYIIIIAVSFIGQLGFVVTFLATILLVIYALPLVTVFMAYRNLASAMRQRWTYDHVNYPKEIE